MVRLLLWVLLLYSSLFGDSSRGLGEFGTSFLHAFQGVWWVDIYILYRVQAASHYTHASNPDTPFPNGYCLDEILNYLLFA